MASVKIKDRNLYKALSLIKLFSERAALILNHNIPEFAKIPGIVSIDMRIGAVAQTPAKLFSGVMKIDKRRKDRYERNRFGKCRSFVLVKPVDRCELVDLSAKDGKGYTTDLSKAEVYSETNALAQHRCRPSDVPWPKEYVDQRTRPAVDMQYVDIGEALKGTGITLSKREKQKRHQYRCHYCGCFLSESDYYSPGCPKCDGDNRP